MISLFRKPKIVLDCFTYNSTIVDTAPVDKAIKSVPEWWAKLPKSYINANDRLKNPNPTLKACTGFIDYYKNSVSLPLWTDVFISAQQEVITWQFADNESKIVSHDPKQYEGYLPPNYAHLKFVVPWVFKCNLDVNWFITEPTWAMSALGEYHIPPGSVNFNKGHVLNIQALCNSSINKDFIIPFGRPLAFLTPLTEKEIVIKRHLVTREEFDRIHQTASYSVSFIDANKKRMRQRALKCPFKNET